MTILREIETKGAPLLLDWRLEPNASDLILLPRGMILKSDKAVAGVCAIILKPAAG